MRRNVVTVEYEHSGVTSIAMTVKLDGEVAMTVNATLDGSTYHPSGEAVPPAVVKTLMDLRFMAGVGEGV